MDDKYLKAFNAVVTFVNDLWDVFGDSKRVTPLALYRRLIEHIKFTDVQAINKSLSGFREFLVTYEDAILTDIETVPRGAVIRYGTSDKVLLEIQKYIYKSDHETREVIKKHLLTIYAIIEPDDKKIAELERGPPRPLSIEELPIDNDTREGQFITSIMHKAKGTMENVDANNPGAAIMGLLQSGVIQDMVVGLQAGVGSGEMDMQKLFGSMQAAMSAVAPGITNSALPPPSNPSSAAASSSLDHE